MVYSSRLNCSTCEETNIGRCARRIGPSTRRGSALNARSKNKCQYNYSSAGWRSRASLAK